MLVVLVCARACALMLGCRGRQELREGGRQRPRRVQTCEARAAGEADGRVGRGGGGRGRPEEETGECASAVWLYALTRGPCRHRTRG